MDRLLDIRLDSGVTFDHLASVYEEYTGKIAVENLRPSWLIFSEGFRKTRLLMTAKRVAGRHLLGRRPAARRADHAARRDRRALHVRGPILYHQRRVGRHGRDVHGAQVQDDARGRGDRHRSGLEQRERHARHAGRWIPAADASRRDAAALERAASAT